MLYARELIGLMCAYPGREWRMVQLVRYVSQDKKLCLRERNAVRRAVHRAIDALCESGSVQKRPPEASRGAPVWYIWKADSEHLEKV